MSLDSTSNHQRLLRVLVGCEFSGVVREAFRQRGHDAWSCDLEESEIPGNHLRCDLRTILDQGWDIGIFHPPCTYLAVSGARWFATRQREQADALLFVRDLLAAPIPRIALENPVSIISTHIRPPDQTIQPWLFGHPDSKRTCLWLKNLPLLFPTAPIEPRRYLCPACKQIFPAGYGMYGCTCLTTRTAVPLWDNMTPTRQNKLPSSASKRRSRTYSGIAAAMAAQWSDDLGDAHAPR